MMMVVKMMVTVMMIATVMVVMTMMLTDGGAVQLPPWLHPAAQPDAHRYLANIYGTCTGT